MVDFKLTEEQQMLKTLAHDFAEKEIKPVAAELDAKLNPAECHSWDLVRKMSKAGFRTMSIPTKYGGGGIEDCLTNVIIAEELSVAETGIVTAVFMSHLKLNHLLEGATEEQREKYLRAYCEDDEFLMSDSITEPESGVDDILPYDARGAGDDERYQKW